MALLSRRSFMETAALCGAGNSLFPGILYAKAVESDEVTVEMIEAAEQLSDLSFTPEQREMMLTSLQGNVQKYQALRTLNLANDVIPSVVFDPQISGVKAGRLDAKEDIKWTPSAFSRPESDEDLAFLTVPELSSLLRSRAVTSVELTQLYLSRLEKYDPILQAVVTLTPERAMRQAQAADAELDAGNWRGPLHGIPWGAKDLLAVRGYPTTWGAMPYKDQVIDADAAVVKMLDEAGAVLVAKLTLGALAMGDYWFGGRTRNPWNPDQGSSGSSAGPGSAVAAGLVGFAIGSETLGSIVSPSTRNGVTGLRPTFGRVSRTGAMTLSWTMDKLGPMCRSAEGCALVFAAIHGADPSEPSTLTTHFNWPSARSARSLRVGYLADAFEGDHTGSEADRAVLQELRRAGLELKPVRLPDMDTAPILMMLGVEAAAAFEGLTLSGEVDSLVRQTSGSWPNSFRHNQFVSATGYVNASRARTLLMQQTATVFEEVDVIISPSFRGNSLRITNLTGHPSVTMPNRFDRLEDQPTSVRRQPGSITFIGQLYQDEAVLAVASLYQSRTTFNRKRPPIA